MSECHAARWASRLAGLILLVLAGCAGPGGDCGPTAEVDTGIGAIMRVADSMRARSDLPTAAGLYRRAHDLEPDAVEPLVQLGFVLRDSGAPRAAANVFEAALVREPGNLEARRGLGLSLLDVADAEAALNQFQAVLAAGAVADTRLYNAIGVAYDMLGNRAICWATARPPRPGTGRGSRSKRTT